MGKFESQRSFRNRKMRTGVEIETLWKVVMKFCKESMRKWTSKTGGSASDPENCTEFKCRGPENFLRHDIQLGTMLTLIFMTYKGKGRPISDDFSSKISPLIIYLQDLSEKD